MHGVQNGFITWLGSSHACYAGFHSLQHELQFDGSHLDFFGQGLSRSDEHASKQGADGSSSCLHEGRTALLQQLVDRCRLVQYIEPLPDGFKTKSHRDAVVTV